MSEFSNILTHGRRLQGAVKEVSTEELEAVIVKLNNIIERRKIKAKEQEKVEKEKRIKVEQIRKQLSEAGLNIQDLAGETGLQPSKKSGQKRPVKYKITDTKGEEHFWTGIGRMPKIFAEALANGKSMDNFKI